MEAYKNRPSQEVLNRHFVRLAEGHKPQRIGNLTLIEDLQQGKGDNKGPKLVMVTPTQHAVEQAKSALKRGIDQTDVYDAAMERDAERKRRFKVRKDHRTRLNKKKPKEKKKPKGKGNSFPY